MSVAVGGGIATFLHRIDVLVHNPTFIVAVISTANALLTHLVDAHVARSGIHQLHFPIHADDEDVQSLGVLGSNRKECIQLGMDGGGNGLLVIGDIHLKVFVHAVGIHMVSPEKTGGMTLGETRPHGHAFQGLEDVLEPSVHVLGIVSTFMLHVRVRCTHSVYASRLNFNEW